MNCNTCKHYDRSKYPYHCELAKEGCRFCNDCLLGVSHYEPKDDCADAEINCDEKTSYAKVHDKYVTIKEYDCPNRIPLVAPHIDWFATILCWLLILFNFTILTLDAYFIIKPVNNEYKFGTAVLIVSFVCLFYVTLKYFCQIVTPKRKY